MHGLMHGESIGRARKQRLSRPKRTSLFRVSTLFALHAIAAASQLINIADPNPERIFQRSRTTTEIGHVHSIWCMVELGVDPLVHSLRSQIYTAFN